MHYLCRMLDGTNLAILHCQCEETLDKDNLAPDARLLGLFVSVLDCSDRFYYSKRANLASRDRDAFLCAWLFGINGPCKIYFTNLARLMQQPTVEMAGHLK